MFALRRKLGLMHNRHIVGLGAFVLSLHAPLVAEEASREPPKTKKPAAQVATAKTFAEPLQRLTLTLAQNSSGDAFCQKVLESLKFHIQSLKRFDLESPGQPHHAIILSCDETMVQGNWGIYLKSKRKKKLTKPVLRKVNDVRIAVDQDLQGNPQAVALRLLRDFQGNLPWDSEIPFIQVVEDRNGVTKSREQLGINFIFGPRGSSSAQHIIAASANGTEASPLLANCLVVELGEIRWHQNDEKIAFNQLGFGIISLSANYTSKVEGYIPTTSLNSLIENENLYYRFTDVSQADRKTRLLVKRCKSKMGELEDSTLDKLLAGDSKLFSAESIELNSIDQRVGAAIFGLNSTNSQRVAPTLGGYVHNTIGIGDNLGLDIRGFSQILSHPYSPGILGGYTDKAKVSIGEFYAFARLNLDALDFDLGIGEVVDGVNILYTVDDVNIANRKQVARIAGMFRTGGMWNSYFFNVRIGYSFSSIGRFVSFSLDNNLKLSKTWYMGSDFSYSSYGTTLRSEPGYNMYSAGLHLGFILERVKK